MMLHFRLKLATIWIALLMAFLSPAHAIQEDTQLWSVFLFQKRLPSDWGAYVEIQPRFDQEASRLDRWILRPAIYLHQGDSWSFWLGYAGIESFRPETAWEHRPWQQAQYVHASSDFVLQHRLRLEQRILPGVAPVGHRFRYLFRGMLPFLSGSPWAWVASDELFLNLNSPSASSQFGFDQNRLFFGVSWAFTSEFRLEWGYLNQLVRRPERSEDQMNHVLLGLIHWTP